MLDGARKFYVPNPLWAPIVAQLTQRFRELDADFGALRREVRGVAIFPELPEDILARLSKIGLRKVVGGYTVMGWQSLLDILINPANIGHVAYKGQIVKHNAHPAIVDLQDYDYALAHLGKVDLDGNPIQRGVRSPHYTQTGTIIRDGLLAGTRENGHPVLESHQGTVYVKTGRQYAVTDRRDITRISPTIGEVKISDTDSGIDGLLAVMIAEYAVSDGHQQAHNLTSSPIDLTEVQQTLVTAGQEKQERARAVLDHLTTLRARVQSSLGTVGDTIASIRAELARKQREYDVARDVMSDQDIKEFYTAKARLQARLADLEKQIEHDATVDADIASVGEKLDQARQEWEGMSLEKKRTFVRLVTTAIYLDFVTNRFAHVTIRWSPLFADHAQDVLLVARSAPSSPAWTDGELADLQALYPSAPQLSLLERFPTRSWVAIRSRAQHAGIMRRVQDALIIPQDLSLEDLSLLDALHIERHQRFCFLPEPLYTAIDNHKAGRPWYTAIDNQEPRSYPSEPYCRQQHQSAGPPGPESHLHEWHQPDDIRCDQHAQKCAQQHAQRSWR